MPERKRQCVEDGRGGGYNTNYPVILHYCYWRTNNYAGNTFILHYCHWRIDNYPVILAYFIVTTVGCSPETPAVKEAAEKGGFAIKNGLLCVSRVFYYSLKCQQPMRRVGTEERGGFIAHT